ncbi:DUF397 domain-containing protein [Cryptosporangium aurantiacum]|uniref:DUF397 domain-containing protein n=1 Tax=Cryptosporangium aurantiacum TaxID=134849 RepID=A0A1M7RL32_9ACTN|nr:DUF397 domain-containing protein [Cryptosporangium aurantiacum]SHN46974.1 protein of unknown function [Cryptosporangium aurantiacum]
MRAQTTQQPYSDIDVVNSPRWLRSSYCVDGDCIEISARDGVVMLRDSKAGSHLTMTHPQFTAFLRFVGGLRMGTPLN